MNKKILFVDDDRNLLDALRRQLRRDYDLDTAEGGLKALELIRAGYSYAVIVSDMRMPDMDGVTLMTELRQLAPGSVRVMLTGNADQETAVKAVNKGEVFRFLTKPCPLAVFTDALDTALEHHRLMHAERELLEGTLNGTVGLLIELLGMATPGLGQKTKTLREMAIEVARAMRHTDTWALEMALALGDISCITLPPTTLEKLNSGASMTTAEKELLDVVPQVSARLLANIPRLEPVAKIIRYQEKHFDGGGAPHDSLEGEAIPLESRILKALLDLYRLKAADEQQLQVVERMAAMQGVYDPRVLETLRWFLSSGDQEAKLSPPHPVNISDLIPGQVLASQVETVNGVMLLTAGHNLTQALIERLQGTHRIHRIKEPILVSSAIGR